MQGRAAKTSALADGVALVTGGGSGFGRAIAHRLAAEGMRLALADIAFENAQAVARELPRAHAYRVDLGDAESIAELARAVESLGGPLRVVCANVGVQQIAALERLSAEDWRWLVGVNLLGTVATVDAFLPQLRRARGLRSILLTGSTSSCYPAPRLGAYTATKYAVLGYGETLRLELAPAGIGVTCVLPAGMRTTHIASSAAAKPATAGPSQTTDDDFAVVGAAAAGRPGDLASPEHASRHVVAALLENRPYLVTHGRTPDAVRERFTALLAAFERADD
jgi:NAD(P)-dependent dehydrogenase (short-subunit alcohol dehydrogenase family)